MSEQTIWMAGETHPHDGWEVVSLHRTREGAVAALVARYEEDNAQSRAHERDWGDRFPRFEWRQVPEENGILWRTFERQKDGSWETRSTRDYGWVAEKTVLE